MRTTFDVPLPARCAREPAGQASPDEHGWPMPQASPECALRGNGWRWTARADLPACVRPSFARPMAPPEEPWIGCGTCEGGVGLGRYVPMREKSLMVTSWCDTRIHLSSLKWGATNMDWTTLEAKVRSIASYRWFRQAVSRKINDVQVDCVLEIEPDNWVLVEVSKQTSLTKLREDLAKFASVRPYLFSQAIYAKCYFVTDGEPNPSLRQTGDGQNVKVLSIEQFSKELIDHSVYAHARTARPFGSAVDPLTGQPDTVAYVPVEYETIGDRSRSLSVPDIARELRFGRRIVLLGQYGVGKSRCLQQVFQELSANAQETCMFPFAIDLRRHWGAKTAEEIVRRHLGELGLTEYADNVIRAYTQGGIIFLLDGFDEIGSQAWSDRIEDLRAVRRDAVAAIRDLVEASNSGVLITGRHHFFDSNSEMLSSLGLRESDAIVAQAPEQFTREQMQSYLESAGISASVPEWLPRRPLIAQVVASLENDDLNRLVSAESGEVSFWTTFVEVLCEREARIHRALSAFGIHAVLRRLARLSRTKKENHGPLKWSEITAVFCELAGAVPVEESTAMLQRLPGLGRLSAESTDRQFVDRYILHGLRADDLVEIIRNEGAMVGHERWIHPLDEFGQAVVAARIVGTVDVPRAIHVARKHVESNPVLSSDVVASLARTNEPEIDFQNLCLRGGEIDCLDLSGGNVCNVRIADTLIYSLHVSGEEPRGVVLEECVCQEMFGTSVTEVGLPSWMVECTVERRHQLNTLERIKQAGLSPAQRVLITIVKKTFFQPGAGRKEAALTRGLGDVVKNSVVKKILNKLVNEGVLEKAKGQEGWVYRPNRSQSNRMTEIVRQLSRSEDPLWTYVSSLDR